MDITESGKTCKVWTGPSQPLGEHNYCRNPNVYGAVGCYTSDSEKDWEYCDVPECPPIVPKLLDFSADNDHQPDSNGSYTSVLLSTKVRHFFFDRMILEKLFDGKLRLGKDFPKL